MSATSSIDTVCSVSERLCSSAEERLPIGVIIPTYNRAEVLVRCLQHLEQQTWKDFEVVIVDDGSTDDTRERVERYARATPMRLRYVRQENSGQAKARNRAATLLRSPVCLMIGDDIFASPNLVRQHLDLHRRRPEENVAALGYTHWTEQGQLVTPFMRWLNEEGLQFAYGELRRGISPSWKHFYTSNLSMKTRALRAHPFNETFRKYGMEDIELGYRLHVEVALQLAFLPDAVTEHLHPTDVSQTCRRMLASGAASFRFGQLWPEHRQTIPKNRLSAFVANELWGLPMLRKVASLLTQYRCPNRFLVRVLHLHYWVGYRRASQEAATSA